MLDRQLDLSHPAADLRDPPAPATPRPRVAILVVNGFARPDRWSRPDLSIALKYPWIELCLRQIERHSKRWDYEVIVFDNSHLKQHLAIMRAYPRVRVLPGRLSAAIGRAGGRVPIRRAGRLIEYALERSHPRALDYLVTRVPAHFDYIVTLDTDSFPVRDDWLDVLVSACERGAAVAGVYRTEMASELKPFVHVSGLCARRSDLLQLGVSFGKDLGSDEHNIDAGQRITYELLRRGLRIAPLQRSNKVNYHFLIGGIYGDVIYHQGAGSRRVRFRTSTDLDTDKQVSVALREVAFSDVDHLIALLRGEAPNDLDLNPSSDR